MRTLLSAELACSITFFWLGWMFLPYPGIQNDEAVFTGPLFRPSAALFHLSLFSHDVPLMLFTYLGALKTWLYAPLLNASVSALALRAPMLAAGSATVWMWVLLLRQLHGERAAWAGGLLLATDSMLLLTTCFDWGPVALQHFLLAAGALLALRFSRTDSAACLFSGCAALGLGVWDKALFLWMLGGLAAGLLAVYPGEIRKRLSLRNAGLAAAGFALGASPLIFYNVEQGWPTFHTNVHFDLGDFPVKAHVLRESLDGSALFGYLVYEDVLVPRGRAPATAVERAAFAVHSLFGDRGTNYNPAALLAALALLPALWRTRARRVLLLCLAAASVAWIQMALTRSAGAAVHHTVLLWPLPHIFVAIAFAEASLFAKRYRDGALFIVAGCLAAANLLVANQYLYQMIRNGSPGSWTDGIYSLSDGIGRIPFRSLTIADWGILPPLELLHRGALRLRWAGDPLLPPGAGMGERQAADQLFSEEGALWVAHTAAFEQFPEVNRRLASAASSLGFEKNTVAWFYDRNGRPVFEAFRFARSAARPKGP